LVAAVSIATCRSLGLINEYAAIMVMIASYTTEAQKAPYTDGKMKEAA
jgi:hypothetical protein